MSFFFFSFSRPDLALFSPTISDTYTAFRLHTRFEQYRHIASEAGVNIFGSQGLSCLRPLLGTKARGLLCPSPSIGNPVDSFRARSL